MDPRIAAQTKRIAADYAASVRYPQMMFSGDAPIGKIAQRMIEGKYNKAFLLSEVERFTGVKIDLPEGPGKILFVIPQHGYWASELTLPDQVFRAAGYEIDYATPRGERPFPYPVSHDPTFRDQAWNAKQVSESEAALGLRYDDANADEGKRLLKPINLREWVPPTPRPRDGSDGQAEASRKEYEKKLVDALTKASEYASMVIVGGAGAYMDLGGETSIRPVVQLLLEMGRPVAAICYGVQVLIQATNPKTKRPLIEGRMATGHSEQDDYTDNTAVIPERGKYSPNFGSAPITLEQMIKQYVGTQGGFISTDGSPYMAVLDGPFITARTTPDGYPAALLVLAYLHADRFPSRFIIDGDHLGREPLDAEKLGSS
jgi:putative intracellular protease/amidase